MATKTIVQTSQKEMMLTPSPTQLSSISLMLEYDIDNTLNTIKESGHLDRMSVKHPLSCEEKQHVPALKTNARKRWKILAKVLRKDSEETISSEDEERTASVRRFKSFDLLQQDNFEDEMALNELGKPDNWYKYRVQLDRCEYSVNIHHMDRHLTAADLMGFNNTGNICVWPSEEALTVYVLSELEKFHGKWILELGGGMTCLTGLMLSKYAKPYAVHLTDGNELSWRMLKRLFALTSCNATRNVQFCSGRTSTPDLQLNVDDSITFCRRIVCSSTRRELRWSTRFGIIYLMKEKL